MKPANLASCTFPSPNSPRAANQPLAPWRFKTSLMPGVPLAVMKMKNSGLSLGFIRKRLVKASNRAQIKPAIARAFLRLNTINGIKPIAP